MNRRTLLSRVTGGISGGFVLGTTGGVATGAVGTASFFLDPPSRLAKHSWSDNGEDLIVGSICGFFGIASPTYLDIGAADPILNSNTYLFYSKGCRGVLIEPNPLFSKALATVRPGDRTIHAGIGFDGRTEADYYMVNGSVMNTFSKDWIDAMAAEAGNRDFLQKVVKMPLLNINKVIAEYFCKVPDFISVDTEGLDLDILKSLDFKRFRPPIVCAETAIVNNKRIETRIIELMQSKDYSVRGSTIHNSVFVDNSLLI